MKKPLRLLRINEVLKRIPIGKSTLWAKIKQNSFPKPVQLGPRTSAWVESDIDNYINSLCRESRLDVTEGDINEQTPGSEGDS